jgi:serine/threonine-protein phosphatase 6 regulatory ankyrin repeat subunit B
MEQELCDKRLVLETFDKFNNPDNGSAEARAQKLLSQLPSNFSISGYFDKDKFTLLHHACYNGWYNVAKRLVEIYNCDPSAKNADGSLPLHLACLGGNRDLIDYIARLPQTKSNDRNNSGETALHFAASKGDKFVVDYLIVKHDADPTIKDNGGQTPLHVACKCGNLDIVNYLVDEQICDPSCATNGGWTPLHIACQNGHLYVAKYFVEDQNCKPGSRNKTNDSTPLHLACQNGHLAVAKYLVREKRCDPSSKNIFGWTALHSACETGKFNIVEYLIEERCSQNETSDGHSPIYLASQNGHCDIVQFLVREQHFAPDCDLWKPLCVACENGYLNVVEFLISKCPKNWKAKAWVLLNSACENGHLCIVRYLVEEHCCDPTRINRANGLTLLHSACRNGHINVVKYLSEERSCVPTRSDCDGWTPLHFACQNGHLIVVMYLIQERDCNPACENNHGWTPLHSASECGRTAVVQYLVSEQYCNSTCKNSNGWTPLHLACNNGHIGVAEYLMDCSDIADIGSDGYTPLHLACQSGHLDLVKTLVSNYRHKYGTQKLVEFITHHGTTDQYKSLSCNSSPFFTALMKGHLKIVDYFVDTVVEQYTSKAEGCTYLHSACIIGDLDIMKYLMQIYYCDAQCQDNDGWTPLHYCCKHGHLQLVEYLVNERNCEVVRCANDGSTPFSVAVNHTHDDIALFLIQKQFSFLRNDCNPCWNVLHSACQVGELDAVKFLITGKYIDPCDRDSSGLAPLHVASENGHLDIVKYLIQEVGCDPMCMTSDAWTPLHSASKNGRVDILKYLLEKEKCDCKCKAFNSMTPLHLSCRYGHLDAVVCLINFRSSILQDNRILDEALSGGNDDIVLLLLSHGVRLSSNVQYEGGSNLVQPALKVFLLGNPMSGKSTLVQAILSYLAQDGWLDHRLKKFFNSKVTGVEPHTAGIIPHHFHSSRCGYLILYDFAGQYEHYSSSHAAILEHLHVTNSCTGCLVLIFGDTCKAEGQLIDELHYWNSFISNQYKQDIQPKTVVIGSHADIAKSDGKEKLIRALKQVPDLDGSTIITLDCRKTNSAGLASLCSYISTCSSQHMEQFKIDAQTHFLNRLLRQKFKVQIACQLRDISSCIECDEHSSLRMNNLLPTDSTSLIEHLSILNEQGQVIFMKDSIDIDSSWIILNEEVLLSHINGSMFAPDSEEFRSVHQQFSSTGVVALSRIAKAFPGYDLQMLIGFMSHLNFCRKLEYSEVLIFRGQENRTCDTENEVYYFFPALVSVERPTENCQSIITKRYKCGWRLCCHSEKNFTSRFLHVLLLDLAFSHALPAEPLKHFVNIECRQCNIWKNGIHWQNNDGVEALVEVVEQNTAVILIVGCLEGREMECTRHRSKLIYNILRIQGKYSGAVECKEAFIHPKELSKYPLNSTDTLFTFSINQLATAIVDKKEVISMKLGSAQDMIEISDIVYFELYMCLSDQLISCICDETYAEKEVTDDFLHDCAKDAYQRVNLIKKAIILLPEQESELSLEIGSYHDQYSKDPIHLCFLIFKTWKKFAPNPTFRGLRETLDKYSIFCGRNPLVREIKFHSLCAYISYRRWGNFRRQKIFVDDLF